jgi:hypothetical protein
MIHYNVKYKEGHRTFCWLTVVNWVPQAMKFCHRCIIAETGFNPWSVYELSMVDTVALEKLSLQVHQFSLSVPFYKRSIHLFHSSNPDRRYITRAVGLLTYLFTYLLTLWSRVLLEKLTVNFAASQKIPRIYEARKFLTVPTSARHLSCLQRKHLYMGNS